MNYGQFRESLDYIRKDFTFLLKDVFSDNYVKVDYEDKTNNLINELGRVEHKFKPFEKEQNYFRRELKRLKIAILFIVLLFLGFVVYTTYRAEKEPIQSIDKTEIQSIIKMELDRINTEKNTEKLIILLEQQLLQNSNNSIKLLEK